DETFPAADEVTPQDIEANQQTIANVRLWDHRPLKDTYNQIQSIRPYYTFDDVDVDRYSIDSQYRQVMLSPRELLTDRLGAQARTVAARDRRPDAGPGGPRRAGPGSIRGGCRRQARLAGRRLHQLGSLPVGAKHRRPVRHDRPVDRPYRHPHGGYRCACLRRH